MILHCTHGQERIKPGCHPATGERAERLLCWECSGLWWITHGCRVDTVLCQDGQTALWVLAGITTSSRQQGTMMQSQLRTEEAIMMFLSVPSTELEQGSDSPHCLFCPHSFHGARAQG